MRLPGPQRAAHSGEVAMGMAQGFGLTLVAGVMAGGNLVPMKWMKSWKWENFWLVYSLMALVVAPVSLAFFLCRI